MFLGAIMLSSMMLFTACTDDSDPVDLPPSISFVAGAGFISDDETVTVNTPFVVKILAQANATSGAKIQSISITRIFNNQTVGDTSFLFNDATVTFEITFMSYPEAGVENIEFEATDKDGQKDKITLQITTQATAGPIFSWTEKINAPPSV